MASLSKSNDLQERGVNMSYRIGYYTTASPLYGAKLAFWRHHDAIFNKLCQESDVELHVILPVYGGSKFMSRLYAGDKSVLYPTLRTMNLVFHQGSREELRDVWESLDALYLDDVHTFSDIEYEGVIPYEAKEFVDYVLSSPENTVKFIFDYRCYIETGNDNEDSCVDNESCNYGEAIMFEKGN